MRALVAACALAIACSAQAATAYLVSQSMGTSVTGMPVFICTYQYGTRTFERAYATMCPLSVEVY